MSNILAREIPYWNRCNYAPVAAVPEARLPEAKQANTSQTSAATKPLIEPVHNEIFIYSPVHTLVTYARGYHCIIIASPKSSPLRLLRHRLHTCILHKSRSLILRGIASPPACRPEPWRICDLRRGRTTVYHAHTKQIDSTSAGGGPEMSPC